MGNLLSILQKIDQAKTAQELTEVFNQNHSRWTRQLSARDMRVIRAHALRRGRQLLTLESAAA